MSISVSVSVSLSLSLSLSLGTDVEVSMSTRRFDVEIPMSSCTWPDNYKCRCIDVEIPMSRNRCRGTDNEVDVPGRTQDTNVKMAMSVSRVDVR